MMLNHEQQENLLKASKYDMLAQFYKYSNPDLHIKYYKKHLKYMEKAMRFNHISPNPNPFIHIRFINLHPKKVDVKLNNVEVLKDVPPNGVSEYFIIPSNLFQMEVFSAGSKENPLKRQRLDFNGENYSTVILTEADTHRFSSEQYVPENETKLRAIHLSESCPSLDVRVKHGDIVFPNVSYGEASDYLGLTPMTVDLELTITKSRNTLLQLPKLHLQANEIYSLLIIGNVSERNGLRTLLVKD